MTTDAKPEFFPDTRWSLIQEARATGEQNADALAEWCGHYLAPIRTYIGSQVRDADRAEELTQEFFEKMMLRGADRVLPESLGGAFRAHLMRAIKNFLIDQWRAGQSLKAGGAAVKVSSETLGDVADGADLPNQAFDQSWALNLMELSLNTLRREMRAKGKGEIFDALAPYLGGRKMTSGVKSKLAAKLGLTEVNLRVSLHRLRVRFRAAIESEIRETVATEAEFQAEKCYILSLWS